MKLLQMQQDSLAAAAAMGGGAGGNVAGMYQNPIFLQQLMWMTMQQQREQVSRVLFGRGEGGGENGFLMESHISYIELLICTKNQE